MTRKSRAQIIREEATRLCKIANHLFKEQKFHEAAEKYEDAALCFEGRTNHDDRRSASALMERAANCYTNILGEGAQAATCLIAAADYLYIFNDKRDIAVRNKLIKSAINHLIEAGHADVAENISKGYGLGSYSEVDHQSTALPTVKDWVNAHTPKPNTGLVSVAGFAQNALRKARGSGALLGPFQLNA